MYMYLRDSKLSSIVEDLFANKDDSQLDCEFEETAIGRTLIQTQSANTAIVTRMSSQAI